jgi:hypothetical protein
MTRLVPRGAGAVVCLLAAVGGPTGARADDVGSEADIVAEEGFVRFEDNHLTANISSMSLSAVLMEVGTQSGALVTLDGFADRTASDRFADVPIEDALRRLLPNENFTVIYAKERGPDGQVVGARVKEIHVYGSGGTRVSNADSAARAQAAPDAQGADGTLMQQFGAFLQRHKAVGIDADGELAGALNTSSPPLTTLMKEAIQNDDPTIRAEAAKVVAGVFDADPETPDLVGGRGRVASDKVDKMASALYASGGGYAEEFLRTMGRNLKTPALRLKANQILARIRRMN